VCVRGSIRCHKPRLPHACMRVGAKCRVWCACIMAETPKYTSLLPCLERMLRSLVREFEALEAMAKALEVLLDDEVCVRVCVVCGCGCPPVCPVRLPVCRLVRPARLCGPPEQRIGEYVGTSGQDRYLHWIWIRLSRPSCPSQVLTSLERARINNDALKKQSYGFISRAMLALASPQQNHLRGHCQVGRSHSLASHLPAATETSSSARAGVASA
jgi:hypothetical protein